MTGPNKQARDRVYTDESGELLTVSYLREERVAILRVSDDGAVAAIFEPGVNAEKLLLKMGLTDLGEL